MRKYKQISKEQRFQLAALLKTGISKNKIASILGIHRSSLYRELKRNASSRKTYCCNRAHQWAQERKERFKRVRKFTGNVKKFIDEKLGMEQWSPEQISGYCKKHGIAMVSPERIYQYVYQDKKLGGKLYKNLRIASKPYRKRYGSKDYRGKIAGRISIDQRQEVVNQRSRIGDWEADTIIGKNHKQAILTNVERKSKFLVMALLSKNGSVYTITSDNGREFTEHKIIAEKLNAQFYFTHPYSAWEKGTNENTNGLIRQYIPKKSDFQQITLEQINEIMQKLNNRPRKSLNYQTPLQVFMSNFVKHQSVALVT